MKVRTGVGVADDGVAGAAAEGHDLVVGWAGHGAVDVELVDDEVRLEPPACVSIVLCGSHLGSEDPLHHSISTRQRRVLTGDIVKDVNSSSADPPSESCRVRAAAEIKCNTSTVICRSMQVVSTRRNRAVSHNCAK